MKYLLFLLLFTSYIYAFSQADQIRYRRCLSGCTTQQLNDDLNESFDYGQSNSWEEFLPIDVVSDYGMRRTNGSEFHPGIDYSSYAYGRANIDRGDAILAVSDGTVARIIVVAGGVKYVSVAGNDGHHYGYYHLFSDLDPDSQPGNYLKSGKFVLKRTEQNNDYWAIVNLESCTAYVGIGALNNFTVKLTGLNNSFCGMEEFPTTTTVISGEEIAPMGDSEAPNGVHLHLYKFKNTAGNNTTSPITPSNSGNPLEFIIHQIPEYSVECRTENNQSNLLNFVYPGTESTHFRLRPTMVNAVISGDRFTNYVMNIEKVAVKIKNNLASNFNLINGPYRFSKIRLGGRNDEIYYPESILEDYGTWTQQGIDPYAYLTGDNHPYDDYYFDDFVTRININDPGGRDGQSGIPTPPIEYAHLPSKCRYKDGKYTLKLKLRTLEILYSREIIALH